MVIPAHWEPWPNLFSGYNIFFGLIKIIMVILKLFMICIRPMDEKYQRSRWAMWFGSTLTQFQIALTMGMVPGNFGGFLEEIHSAAFNAFRQYFWMDPTHLWSQTYADNSKSLYLGKFETENFYPSPLQENLPELIFFALGTLIGITGCGDRKNRQANHMRIGA